MQVCVYEYVHTHTAHIYIGTHTFAPSSWFSVSLWRFWCVVRHYTDLPVAVTTFGVTKLWECLEKVALRNMGTTHWEVQRKRK